MITIVSSDQLELYISDSDINLLCEYSVQGNKLRVVATISGTPQVLYFDITAQGLVAKDGAIMYSPQQYTEKTEAARKESQRLAELSKKSREKTTIIEKFELAPIRENNGCYNTISPNRITITDVSIELEYPPREYESTRAVGYFADFNFIRQITGICDVDHGISGFPIGLEMEATLDRGKDKCQARFCLFTKSREDAQILRNTLVKAFDQWSKKYPKMVPKHVEIDQ